VAKTWILDTETKGTGAHMAPLRPAGGGRAKEGSLALVELKRPARPPRESQSPRPIRFRVTDAMSGRVLAEDVGVRDAVRALEGMRSALDARIAVRSGESGRWRLLGLEQRRELWSMRGRMRAAPAAEEPAGSV
jgi:hypothetical protein